MLSFPGGAEIEGSFVNDEIVLDQPLVYKGYMQRSDSTNDVNLQKSETGKCSLALERPESISEARSLQICVK